MRLLLVVCIGFMLVLSVGCERTDRRASYQEPIKEPRQVAVQHVLISFDGSRLRKEIGRTKDEAEALAMKVFEAAKSGEDFSNLVIKYSDDYEDEEAETETEEEEEDGQTEGQTNKESKNSEQREVVKSDSQSSDSDSSGAKSGSQSREPAVQSESDSKFELFRQPGVYRVANRGEQSAKSSLKHLSIYARKDLVPQFGDVAFGLEVGEVGMTTFDPRTSPTGWHIIKRID